MYHALAHLYDWPGAMDFSEILLEKTLTQFKAHGIEAPAPILDLACGTGTIAIKLAQQNWDLIGIDGSTEMLEQARKKTPTTLKNIQWQTGDMRTFQVETAVAAVLCYTDSLNHLLSDEDLEQSLQATYKALSPNGLFLFDVNTEANYQLFWDGSDTDEGPNFRLSFQSSYNPETQKANAKITAEEHTEEGLMVNEDSVIQRYYSETLLEELLKKVGFEVQSKTPMHLSELFAQEKNKEENKKEESEPQAIKTFWQCVKK